MTKKFGGALQQLQQAKEAARRPDPGTPEVRKPVSLEVEKSGSPDAGPRMEKYTTTLDKGLILRLKMHALQNDLKHQDVVAEALEAYLLAAGQGRD
ncbi:hypothetical protein EHF33_20620 (plasmid) [Deinococcus psychrotolerans]|uniref:Uncharacterized protein n=1 Tax=Deinococcus psychrotolerans TaxID=2489213 RepID=A0A3G8YVW8_9DEIO|nr:hypothetical protein [Deinococcus psychrotolerans]AZI45316.1 hypothetical protein EHF33_20620 [Deinococcus psychrotolerans]